MSMHEKKLRDELYKWRDATAKTDMAEYEDFGGDILMHYRIVERIVELAHAQKLNTVQDIQEHANWCWAQQYGTAVLALVQKYCPKPVTVPSSPFTTVPLETGRRQQDKSIPAHSDSHSTSTRRPRAPPVCGACGLIGHRKNSPLCQNKPQERFAA
ncbi:hypothetical protein BC835DRAFT_1417358 [Cytidiella melzeri]|nr:hypothetical protein BC835DRAFT_1417358 [Cytidiella melzeri]